MTESNTSTLFLIREATQEDAEQVKSFLSTNRQSAHAILVPGTRYWIAQNKEGHVVGAIGLEYGVDAALLRSVGVLEVWRGQRIGALLTQHSIEAARRAGCERVYLFSTDAGSYWAQHNFYQVPVEELVAALPNAPQVQQYDELGCLPTEVAWRRDLIIAAHE